MEKIIGKNAKGEIKVYNVEIRKLDYPESAGYTDIERKYLPDYPEVEYAKDEEGNLPTGTLVYTSKTGNADDFVEWIKDEFDDPTKIKKHGTKHWTHEDGEVIPHTFAPFFGTITPTIFVMVDVSDPTEEEMAIYKATI